LIAVTGVTGGIGSRVSARLAERGADQVLVARDPSRAPDLYGAEVRQVSDCSHAGDMRAALEGVDTLLLVSFEESRDRVARHAAAIDAAVAAGVERIVYTSFFGADPDATFILARDHFHTEEHLRASGVGWTVLRDNIYLDVIPYFAGADGKIRGPAGEGRSAAVARDDIADVAVEALTDDAHEGQTYELTGPEAITMAEAADRLSDFVGETIEFVDETIEEAWESRRPSGEPDWIIEGWVSTYLGIANGDLDGATHAVEAITGHPPINLEEQLSRYPESYAHLTGD